MITGLLKFTSVLYDYKMCHREPRLFQGMMITQQEEIAAFRPVPFAMTLDFF